LAVLPLLLVSSFLSAQTAAQVKAKLTDGTGSVYRQGFLHFELHNCGANFPIVPGIATTVVQPSVNLKANQTDGIHP
jgi:hypothetical protein